MVRINTISVSIDMGIIPPVNRVRSKIFSIGIKEDFGVIPPKNYFKGKISIVGVSCDKAENSTLIYQVN